jgi:hypothetical protein
MSTRNTFFRGVLALAAVGFAASANAAVVIIDDFEGSEGHFALDPDFSGSNRGLLLTAPGAGPSTADLDATRGYTGTSSERLSLVADPATDRAGFEVRFLSGSGTPANNINIGPDGFVGFFARTTQENVSVQIGLDDGAGLERSIALPVPSTGEWTLVQFNLDDADQWNSFAGTANGTIDQTTVTIDSIFILSSVDQTVDISLDTVAYNTTGDLSSLVPEPASLGLLGVAGLSLLARRRRGA